jgi:hypothetical protein
LRLAGYESYVKSIVEACGLRSKSSSSAVSSLHPTVLHPTPHCAQSLIGCHI